MRIMEALRLRVKDVDFARFTLIVRSGKGNKDRALMLPQALVDDLRAQLAYARSLWALDRADQITGVEMPEALARKYPRAAESWAWHWVFPQASLNRAPRSGVRRRHHLFDQTFQRANAPRLRPGSTSPPRRTRFGTHAPPACCRPATTFEPCRSRLVTPT